MFCVLLFSPHGFVLGPDLHLTFIWPLYDPACTTQQVSAFIWHIQPLKIYSSSDLQDSAVSSQGPDVTINNHFTCYLFLHASHFTSILSPLYTIYNLNALKTVMVCNLEICFTVILKQLEDVPLKNVAKWGQRCCVFAVWICSVQQCVSQVVEIAQGLPSQCEKVK